MDERDQMQELYKAAMREKIAAGMASLRTGHGSDGETFIAGQEANLGRLSAVHFRTAQFLLVLHTKEVFLDKI